VAQDSDGNQYPVTETDPAGFDYCNNLPETEDQALDYCYYESDNDPGCFLVGCTPTY
jgi:hypothetical protein